MTDKKTPELTPVSEWKKDVSEGAAVELPSGKVAKLRRRSIFALVRSGQIPNELKAIVQSIISSPAGAKAVAGENLEAMFAIIDIVATACFVYPKLADGGTRPLTADEIDISDVDFDDKLFVYLWSAGEVSSLESFRKEQDSAISVAFDGKSVQPEAE